MVQFGAVDTISSWLANADLEQLFLELVEYLESDFSRWEQFDKRPRVANHSEYGVIELMPIADLSTYSFKYVNGHPINTKRGMQTVTAFGVLADVESGYPVFVSEMTILTALRTAGTAAMAAKYLAPSGTDMMAMVGCGAQSEFQAIAQRAVLGINQLQVSDVDPQAAAKFSKNLSGHGFQIKIANSADEAVDGAKLITTCTADKTNAIVLSDHMVDSGVHINGLGGDCPGKTELDPDLVARADVFVEFEEQTRVEGDIQRLPADFPVTELWEVITGQRKGRTSDDEFTVFDSVGFALEDFTVLRFVRDKLEGTQFHEEIDLIAEPSDPKNLFSLIGESR